jgi:hypothetical protein
VHAMKACRENGCIASLILNLGSRWRWVVSFMPQPLYPYGKNSRYPLHGIWVGPRASLDIFEKGKISCLNLEWLGNINLSLFMWHVNRQDGIALIMCIKLPWHCSAYFRWHCWYV